MCALIPMAPASAVNRPVMSGPKPRRKWLPVSSTDPSASTIFMAMTPWAKVPLSAPQKVPFWLMPPPTVALMPDSVPHSGVRRPRGFSASCKAFQVQPASTVTVMSVSSMARMRSIAAVSTISTRGCWLT